MLFDITPLAASLAVPYLLVALRMFGMLWGAPLVGSDVVSHRVRIILALTLSLVVTPALLGTDVATAPLRLSSFDGTQPVAFWVNLLTQGVAEFMLGTAMGLGVRLIFAGVEFAGTLIDQQSGLALGEVFDPLSGGAASPTGRMLFVLCGATYLMMSPAGGDLRLLRSLLETFDHLPIGQALGITQPTRLLHDLVLQSLVLSLQLAAPIFAVMSLVTLLFAWAARSGGNSTLVMATVPVRITIALCILIVTLGGLADRIEDSLRHVTDGIAHVGEDVHE